MNRGIEDIEHFLLQCNKYDRERDALIKRVGPTGMETERLLGDPDLILHPLNYVEKIARFSF